MGRCMEFSFRDLLSVLVRLGDFAPLSSCESPWSNETQGSSGRVIPQRIALHW
jgi:hypothetical protein